MHTNRLRGYQRVISLIGYTVPRTCPYRTARDTVLVDGISMASVIFPTAKVLAVAGSARSRSFNRANRAIVPVHACKGIPDCQRATDTTGTPENERPIGYPGMG